MDSKSSNTIRTHSFKWVKSHCRWHYRPDYASYYTYNKARGYDIVLWTPVMDKECCGKTFTPVSYDNATVNVKETDYIIPMWLLTNASKRRLVK